MKLKVDDLAIIKYNDNDYSIGIITEIDPDSYYKYRMKILISTADGWVGREYNYREHSLEPFDENTKLTK